jgi:hypothetical protein
VLKKIKTKQIFPIPALNQEDHTKPFINFFLTNPFCCVSRRKKFKRKIFAEMNLSMVFLHRPLATPLIFSFTAPQQNGKPDHSISLHPHP